MMNDKIIEKMKEYEIEDINDFRPNFYTMNLVNKVYIESKAINNLREKYSNEELILVENYDEIGIVEYVADNQFYIKDNKIIKEEL